MGKLEATVCKSFAAGHCANGSLCKLMHISVPGTVGAEERKLSDEQPAISLATPSSIGDLPTIDLPVLNLNFEVCKNFAAGHCEQGSVCQFMHITPPDGINPRKPCPGRTEPSAAPPLSKPSLSFEVCKQFAAGHCEKGNLCRFMHVTPPDRLPAPSINISPLLNLKMDICKEFSAGHCAKGDVCQFIHVSGPPSLGTLPADVEKNNRTRQPVAPPRAPTKPEESPAIRDARQASERAMKTEKMLDAQARKAHADASAAQAQAAKAQHPELARQAQASAQKAWQTHMDFAQAALAARARSSQAQQALKALTG